MILSRFWFCPSFGDSMNKGQLRSPWMCVPSVQVQGVVIWYFSSTVNWLDFRWGTWWLNTIGGRFYPAQPITNPQQVVISNVLGLKSPRRNSNFFSEKMVQITCMGSQHVQNTDTKIGLIQLGTPPSQSDLLNASQFNSVPTKAA